MRPIAPTRLENWLRGCLCQQRLSIETLQAYQLDHLNLTLAHVRKNSPFYRQRLGSVPDWPLTDLRQTAELPMTTAEDLRQHNLNMLCVSHGEVTRVVTMHTSGTTAAPKRLYFTEEDLERNIDFFHHGLTCMAEAGESILIMLPSNTPDSAGDQLKRAAARVPMAGHIHWPVLDLETILKTVEDLKITCLVGAPAQIFALCRHERYARRLKPNPIKSVLLTTDYVPRVVVDELRKVWECRVFEHYGMSEMGLGGALECDAHQGYHIREADLLVEVIDPDDAVPLLPGVEGEVVFTTLTRQAMPLIRYRTGDRAAWMEEPCPCGTVMRRLGKVRGRIAHLSSIHAPLSMPLLDETILSLPGVYSFKAAVPSGQRDSYLDLDLFCRDPHDTGLKEAVVAAVGALTTARQAGPPTVRIRMHSPEALRWDGTGMIKRTIG